MSNDEQAVLSRRYTDPRAAESFVALFLVYIFHAFAFLIEHIADACAEFGKRSGGFCGLPWSHAYLVVDMCADNKVALGSVFGKVNYRLLARGEDNGGEEEQQESHAYLIFVSIRLSDNILLPAVRLFSSTGRDRNSGVLNESCMES